METKKLILPCLRGLFGDIVYYSSLMTPEQISKWIDSGSDYLNDYLITNKIVVEISGECPVWREFDLSKVQQEYGDQFKAPYFKESMGLMVFNGFEKMTAIEGQRLVRAIKLTYERNSDNKISDDNQYSVIFVAKPETDEQVFKIKNLFSEIN